MGNDAQSSHIRPYLRLSRLDVAPPVNFGDKSHCSFIAQWHSGGADHQALTGSVHGVWGDRAKAVDLHDALDLTEPALDQAEVATGDPEDRPDRLSVRGEVLCPLGTRAFARRRCDQQSVLGAPCRAADSGG